MKRRSEQAEELVREDVILPSADAHPVLALVPPPFEERRGAHAMKDETPTGERRGAHVMKGDPLLSIENRALHAAKIAPQITPELCGVTAEVAPATGRDPVPTVVADGPPQDRAAPVVTLRPGRRTRQGVHATGSHRWRLVPVAGAASALVLGLGGGAAFAYLRGSVSGSGTGATRTGSPVTLGVVGTAGTADLLPGHAGAAHVVMHNANSFRAVFDQVAPGATVVSDNTDRCASSFASIAQTLPYTFSPAVAVSPGGTSGTQSIPNLVKLAPDAPSTCQGVIFTVTLTLSGESS
jgi:hypothetical protein